MTSPRQPVRVLIIGSGPAGYTAAIYAARAGLEPVMVAGMQPGGQLTITTDVENYPGFGDVIQGPWLMEQMRIQAEKVGTTVVWDLVTEVDFQRRPYLCRTDGGTEYLAETVIIATGAQARWLGIPGEAEFQGHGLSACATCDGFFAKGLEVAVIGGGNTAVEEALFLTRFASKVYLIHRRDTLRAERILIDRLNADPKIVPIWNTRVLEFLGETAPNRHITGLRLGQADGHEQVMPIGFAFVAIGHDPATALFRGQLKIDDHGYILTAADSTATGRPGIFAAGDVRDRVYRQAVTAAGMGCMAALEAERFLAEQAAGLAAHAA